ncbi:MAG TPA: hypothetical protein VIR04_01820 [Paralcaligenes sp.]
MPLSTGLLSAREQGSILRYPLEGLYVLAIANDEICGGEQAYGPNDYMEQAIGLLRHHCEADIEIYRADIVKGVLINPIRTVPLESDV